MKIIVLTTTFYNNKSETRFHLACQLIGNAVAAGYDVIIVDGSADPSIRNAFVKIGASVHSQMAQGMGNSRRELFAIAANTNSDKQPKIFLWVEPEKVDLIRSIPKIVTPIERGRASIVIPSRTEKSWGSYPQFQVSSEQEANAAYLKVVGKPFDPMFGPVAFEDKIAAHFAICNPAKEFGATDSYIQHIATLTAFANGNIVRSVPVDFFYPLVQRVEEESELRDEMLRKRQSQLDQLVNDYHIVAKALNFRMSV